MSEEPKKKGGRPRKDYKLPDNWEEVIMESGKNGKHITDFLIQLNLTYDQHYRLLERRPDYKKVFLNYQKECENWWFDQAHYAMSSGQSNRFNQRLWTIIMKNKFRDNWHDDKQIDITTQGDKINDQGLIQVEIIKNDRDE